MKILPQRFVYGFARLFACLGYALASRHRKVAFESLTTVFKGQKSDREIKQIAFGCFDSMAKSVIEFLAFFQRPHLIERYVTIEGLHNLNQALEKKKGIVAVGAHFGNFPLLLMTLARQGYKVHAMLRVMRDPWVNEYFTQKRHAVGVGSIFTQPRSQCVNRSLEVLRNNEILFIQLDQNFGTGGIFVDFFGRKAATAKGPIVFALRTNAPIVPMFIFREENNRQRLVIEPELPVIYGKDFDETIQLTAQKITAIIEGYVRRYPAEWSWIHRRWKARPKEERENAGKDMSFE